MISEANNNKENEDQYCSKTTNKKKFIKTNIKRNQDKLSEALRANLIRRKQQKLDKPDSNE